MWRGGPSEDVKDGPLPDGGTKAAETLALTAPNTAGEEKTDVITKPTNGVADIPSTGQSGADKKLSLFRRLSFTRSKQPEKTDKLVTPATQTSTSSGGLASTVAPPHRAQAPPPQTPAPPPGRRGAHSS
ncbi:hypothetical protein CRUP_031662, partial [Coryphaenoides rupestris]